MEIDPTGHIAFSSLIIGAIVGALITTGTAYAIDVVNNFEYGFDGLILIHLKIIGRNIYAQPLVVQLLERLEHLVMPD